MKQNRKKGQALAEYIILTALIGIGSMAIVQVLSSNLRRKVAQISESVRGEKSEISGVKASEKHYKVYDMGDFDEAITDNAAQK